MMIYWAVLVAAISTSLVGQLLLKAGTGDGTGSFIAQLFRWQTMVGLGCYGGAALLYIIALRKIPMSVALPCTASAPAFSSTWPISEEVMAATRAPQYSVIRQAPSRAGG